MKNNLFARICRVAGRFSLCIGVILLIGTVALTIAPHFPNEANPENSSLSKQSVGYLFVRHSGSHPDNLAETISLDVIGFALAALIIIAFILVMRRYNADIRKVIGKIAHVFSLSIHHAELLLTVLAWGAVIILTIFNEPILSIFTLYALVINELFFIFAWTAYGCKEYTL